MAVKIDEYVPIKIPINNVTTNGLILSPPNNAKAVKVKSTVKLVASDLFKVSPSDWSAKLSNSSALPIFDFIRFSLIRSKTTIVS